LHVIFKKEKSYLACIQQLVKALAGSRRIGMKTARPGVE